MTTKPAPGSAGRGASLTQGAPRPGRAGGRGGRRLRPAAWVALAAGLIASTAAHAQENVFNVPLSKIAPAGELFVQQQALYAGKLELDLNSVYGLGRGFEVGLNLLNFDVARRGTGRFVLDVNHDDPAEPYAPLIMPSVQKSFELHEALSVAVGTQTGVNVGGPARDLRVASLSFLNLSGTWPGREHRLVIGGYFGTRARLGEGDRFGLWVASEIAIVEKALHLEAEYISGRHALSNFIVGPKVFLSEEIDIAAGAVLPGPGSGNPHGAIVQLEIDDLIGHE